MIGVMGMVVNTAKKNGGDGKVQKYTAVVVGRHRRRRRKKKKKEGRTV